MSPRHAHSKRRRWDPPRTYNASTGLTGVSEAELAHRTEITEAAMVLAEKSAAKAAKSPRFKLPKASPGPVDRPPRVFALPAGPVPSSGTGAGAGIPAPAGPDEPETRPSSEPETATPAAQAPAASQAVAAPVNPGPAAERSPRALASRLTATVAATEAAMAKVAKVGKPDRSDDRVPPPTVASTKSPTTKSPSGKSPTKSVPQASRAPKGGSRWRSRTPDPDAAGVANRRTPDRTRPTSAPSSKAKVRRFALPLTGQKSGEAESGAKGAKVPTGSSASDSSRRHFFSRATPAAKGAGKSTPATKKEARPAKPKSPANPQERRQRIPLVLAGVFAVAVLATSFPLSSLLSQHHQLSAAAAQLQQVQKVNRALTQQQHALDSNVAVNQLARSNYQMVNPGQTLYDVLPPSHSTGATTPGSATSGDPGSQPLVAPAAAPDLSPQPGLPQPIPTSAAGSADGTTAAKSGTSAPVHAPIVPPAPSTFWGRVSNTLQFWR